MMKLTLASASPRRRELLERAGLRFDVRHSEVIEQPRPDEDGASFALRMARDKAVAVSNGASGRLVIGADTVVECDGAIMGKPLDAADARAMLSRLSGRTHTVITAFAIARDGVVRASAAVTSRVTFRALSADEIEAYIATCEPFDKAGAYGIQGFGGTFIDSVEGSRDNVMGLPVAEVLAALARLDGVGEK